VQKLLEILAFEGSLTTWEMAKSKFSRDTSPIRSKEKEYRRLLIGREDRGKRSPGIIDVGLVTKIKDYNRGPSSEYRLTPHGILYCLDVLDFNNDQIDLMVSKYASILPKVFGRWENLKQIIGDDVYKIRLLSKGLTLDNTEIIKTSNIPFYELMSFITTKYRENFEYASEEQLSDQISFWFLPFSGYSTPCGLMFSSVSSDPTWPSLLS